MSKGPSFWFIAKKPELKDAREKKGYTQRQVVAILNAALQMRYSHGQYSKVENQIHPFNLNTALEVSRLFGKRIDQLFISKELFLKQQKESQNGAT